MINGVMIQYFEWNLPNDGNLWKNLKSAIAHLKEIGISAVWLPPANKAITQDNPGYAAYDLYDLGEFDQKGSIRTKYGTKEELKEAIAGLQQCGIAAYMDVVMNHKAGADSTEKFLAVEVDPNEREKPLTEPYEIEGWTYFDFPGRGNKYSEFKWHWYHFSGTDLNNANQKQAVYCIVGENKGWSSRVDPENGNFDYLMFADLDYNHPDVVEEMKRWGGWIANELNLDGMRLDAVKHIDNLFVKDFIQAMKAARGDKFYFVGEYWKRDMKAIDGYLDAEKYYIDLFDVPLHYNFYDASKAGGDYDLRNLFNDTIVKKHPISAVTFVDNHDSQEGSSLESEIEDWFKPIAYALILLMKDGYPCLFYKDYYGSGDQPSIHRGILDTLLYARKTFAYGEQHDYFDSPNLTGFVRLGDENFPDSGLALVVANKDGGNKKMNVGIGRKGETWQEITGSIEEDIIIDDEGNGSFGVQAGKVAVWAKKQQES